VTSSGGSICFIDWNLKTPPAAAEYTETGVLTHPEPVSKDQWTLVRNARQLLTLRGQSGPRGGSAMTDLTVIPNGALLIRNGLIEEAGPTRRVENLANSRNAREIDATGRVVMPAFVDPDVALVMPVCPENAVRLMSRKRVVGEAAATSSEYARYGVLSVGAHTRAASDLANIRKVLRTHQRLRLRPLRIRSVFSPQFPAPAMAHPAEALETLSTKWLPAIRQRKLCSVVELTLEGPERSFEFPLLYEAAVSAASLGFTLRLRSPRAPAIPHLDLAFTAGAIGIVAPIESNVREYARRLLTAGCVRVVPASEAFDSPGGGARSLRNAIDEGCAIALSSSYRAVGLSSINPQYLLHLAVHHLGLTAEEAIVAMTWNAACSLRLSQVAGSLEPGKSADVLVMGVPDYRELPRRVGHHDVSVVIRGGQVLFRHTPLSVD
jgi:imidazolonepropionase